MHERGSIWCHLSRSRACRRVSTRRSAKKDVTYVTIDRSYPCHVRMSTTILLWLLLLLLFGNLESRAVGIRRMKAEYYIRRRRRRPSYCFIIINYDY
jgi:hypothetical protein